MRIEELVQGNPWIMMHENFVDLAGNEYETAVAIGTRTDGEQIVEIIQRDPDTGEDEQDNFVVLTRAQFLALYHALVGEH